MQHPHRDPTTHDLTEFPEGSAALVTAVPTEVSGRRALRVEPTGAISLHGKPGVDYVDMPTFLIIPASLENGTIGVDILSRLNDKGRADARAFADIAYRTSDGGDRFEGVSMRPLNGWKTNPPSRRDQRAVQYFAYPDGSSTGYAKSSPTGATRREQTLAQMNGSP
jgi:hypothetical protein